MKHNYLNIFIIMLAGLLAACTDDFDALQPGEGEEEVYTLRLIIDNGMQHDSRGTNTVEADGIKSCWCYGDVVTLSNDSKTFTFTIPVVEGKNEGDPVEGEALFTYTGSAIAKWSTFTGTLTYSGTSSKNDKINTGSTGLSNVSVDYTRVIDCYKYAMQSANNNTDHLASVNYLSAQLKDTDLRTATIVMKRQFSILKIVLDDIYYDLYGGSLLFVDGFTPVGGTPGTGLMAMVLGKGIVGKESNQYAENTLKLNNEQNPSTNLGVDPFYVVSPVKQPFTGYAERDESHKLVVYIPVFEDREVIDGECIKVYLRDSWTTDWYMWESAPLRSTKLKFGNQYTVDFTRKLGDRYLYESLAAINLGHSHLYGVFGCKNIGADQPTDVGDFYMFGQSTPIVEGEPYPYSPDGTPYFYYTSSQNKDYLGYTNRNGLMEESFQFIDPESYGNGNAELSQFRLTVFVKTLSEMWRRWIPQLMEMPSFMGTWTLPPYAKANTFKGVSTLLPTIIGQDGQETTDTSNPAGVRLENKRTGHCIYLPVSGVLEPSEPNNEARHIIEGETVAQMIEGTENYALFTGQYLFLPPIAEGKDVKLITYVSKTGEVDCPKERMYFPLFAATPIRPALQERDLNEILPALPGWTGN